MTNNIKYRQIKAFCLAANEGSFVAGARLLHVSQPSFTALIKGLEDDLGMQLFERTTRNCCLTIQGHGLYETLSRVLTDLEEVYQYAKDEGKGFRGKLSVAALPSLTVGFLAQAVAAFHELYPAVRIILTDMNSDEVIEAVRTNRVDLGVGPAPVDTELDFMPLFTDDLLVAGVPEHPVFSQACLDWSSLVPHEICMIGGGATAHEMALVNRGKVHPVEVTHLAAAISMARCGKLLAIIPSIATAGLNTKGLRFEPLSGSGTTRQLGTLFKRQRTMPLSARHFMDLMAKMAVKDGGAAIESTQDRQRGT